MLAYIIARLKEPSTYAGIAAVAALAGLKITPEAYQAAVSVIVAVAGAAAIFLPQAPASK